MLGYEYKRNRNPDGGIYNHGFVYSFYTYCSENPDHPTPEKPEVRKISTNIGNGCHPTGMTDESMTCQVLRLP